jgi:amino acid permease
MVIITQLVIAALMAYWTYTIADHKGFNKIIALFLGFLFGIFAVIVYAILKPTKEVQLEQFRKMQYEANKQEPPEPR